MKNVVAILFVFIAATCSAAEEPPKENPLARPFWADNEKPESMRGRILGGRLKEENGKYAFTIIPLSEQDLRIYDTQLVEVKGYYGWNRITHKFLFQATTTPQILVPAYWSIPFLLLLACIACFPFISKRFWEHHYHHISILLGLAVVIFYVMLLGEYGKHKMLETLMDYFKFIALIGSLFTVTGGILIDISGEGSPFINTLLLGIGSIVANLFGTTGASALLIRPYLRINKERIRPFHVVFFIFIVSNVGGALTPIGDPPLFLGYLKGVPFHWTMVNCAPAWALATGLLLWIFFMFDTMSAPKPKSSERTSVRISGGINFLCLGLVLFGVFLDKLLAEHVSHNLEAYPFGAILMIVSAAIAYKFSNPENIARNEFNFGPIKEVAFLFIGIFATMVPALDYLAANAANLHIVSPGGFYFGSGLLSSFLDNAPTYLNFLTAAFGLKGMSLDRDMTEFIARYPAYLLAVSLGSVFFGACTYIGNGPNFMVKAIADSSGAPTPSFFGYIFKYTFILVLIYTLVWFIFLRAPAV